MSKQLEKTDPQRVVLPPSLDRHRLLNANQVAEAVGFSVAHLRRLYRGGKFPKPVMIGSRKLGWPVGVILDLTSKHEAA